MGVIPVRNVVLAMVFITLTMVVADSDPPTSKEALRGSRWTVHIANKMDRGGVLFVHCKSKDDDLGAHNITFNREFAFSFKENFLQTTLFWCYFSSSHGHAEFNVFWPERRHAWLEDHCNNSDCIWLARDDGIHLRNIPISVEDYKHDWNTTSPST